MLTQEEADALITMQKKRKTDERYDFPLGGESLTIPVVSTDEQEEFLIDISRGRIRLTKCTYQERYRATNILVRLDIDGPPHTNPAVDSVPLAFLEPYSGHTIECPHLHLYVEGYMDKWAIPAPSDKFPDADNLNRTLNDFFDYCNVIERPHITYRGLLDEF